LHSLHPQLSFFFSFDTAGPLPATRKRIGHGHDAFPGFRLAGAREFEHDQVVANLTSIENATGTNNDDVLIGNSANNVLTGGGGHDILTGGAGNDTFRFNDQSDSPAVPLGSGIFNSLDQITDFTPGQDYIDLRGLANETAGHAPLNFTDHFTGAAGQVVAAFMSDGTSQHTGFLVAADLNGDHAADFEIFVHTTESHVHLTASDFLL
jgi:Ca2+-binding RTX toxin-like protein